MFWLLRPRPRGCADQPGSASPAQNFPPPPSLFGPRLLPAALTSRALPCSGHGSDASRTPRAAGAHTGGPEVSPCLACSQERPCLLGGTGPLRRPRTVTSPSCQGALPSASRLGPLPMRFRAATASMCLCSPRCVSCTHTHTHAHVCTHRHTHAHQLHLRASAPFPTPRVSHFLSPTHHKPVSSNDADERYLHPVIRASCSFY